jgi:hypothetical protein
MRRVWLAGAGVAVAVGTVGVAHADPRLDEVVYDPYVESGVLELEARSAGLVSAPGGAAAAANVLELEYGLNSHLSLALVGIESQEPHGPARWSDVGLEGIWIVERPLNAPDGGNFASYGYAASATWRTVGALRLGAETLGDLGDDHRFGGRQGAYVGPQVRWEFRPFGGKDVDADGDEDGDEDASAARSGLPVEVDVDTGWLAAVGADRSEAASQIRIALELERKF